MPIDSPLRRSDVATPKTPQQRVQQQQNDDEAERRARRSTAYDTDDSTVDDNENLKVCLQMYNDNKLTKENAWEVNVIDSFSNLLTRHDRVNTSGSNKPNLQFVGSSLEASAKVYSLRVDSVHTNCMRIASELTRSGKKGQDQEEGEGGGDEGDKENDESATEKAAGTQKKQRKRRKVSTIVANKQLLNAKLETVPFRDPFFAKLNSVVGDVNATNRLMQNLLPTSRGEMKLNQDLPFWDPKEAPNLEVAEEETFEGAEFHTISLPGDVSDSLALHSRLKGYRLSDQPAEDEDDEFEKSLHDLSNRSLNATSSQAAALIFDPHAEVEQVDNGGNDFVMEYEVEEEAEADHGLGELTEEDRSAIAACRGLRRAPVIIEDMRPVDSRSSELEYSYRPLDMISQFWAGPSHWKYRKLRSSVPKASLGASPAVSEPSGSEKVVRKRAQRKKAHPASTIQDFLNFSTDLFVPYDPKKPLRYITYSKQHINKNWNSKKLSLPTNLDLDKDMFTTFQSAPSINLNQVNPDKDVDVPVGEYNYDNNQDKEYCREVNQIETDAETETDCGNEMDHHNVSDEMIPPEGAGPVNQTLNFIPTEFANAPEKVEKIIITYAKRAKPVDMKQLKAGCWQVVNEMALQNLSLEPGQPLNMKNPVKFQDMFDELPKHLSKTMAENVSCGLAFYSILHLANEKGLVLEQQGDLKDIMISLPK